jgi:hypothetical protein
MRYRQRTPTGPETIPIGFRDDTIPSAKEVYSIATKPVAAFHGITRRTYLVYQGSISGDVAR